ANTLTATTAAHVAGVVNVAVSNVNGSDTLVAAYTFVVPPTISSVAPANGSPLGGDVITVSGAGFDATTTVAIDGIAAATTFVNATTLTATTPAHAAGIVDVSVSNAIGSDTLSAAFTYDNPPTLISLSPTNGSPLGGDTITLTGTDFTADATVSIDGVAAATTFVSTTTLTAVTPVHVPGTVDVTVDNINGTSTLVGGFTYNGSPMITAVTPSSGHQDGGDTVTISGSGFIGSEVVTFDGLSAAVTFVDSNTLTAITPAHAPGSVDVAVSNLNGSATLFGGYTYLAPPTIASIAPNNGALFGGDTITVTGTALTADTVVSFDGVAAVTTFVSSTTVTAVTPAHAPGTVDVSIANSVGSDTLVAAYTYNDPPLIGAVTPNTGDIGGGETVTISGTGFTADAIVSFDGIAAATTFVDSMTLTAITPAHAVGPVLVTVSSSNGTGALAGGFTYSDGSPTVTEIAPTSGSPLGGATVTVTGTNFTATSTVSFGGTPSPAVTFISATTLEAVTPPHTPGLVAVQVTNSFGTGILPAAYTYEMSPMISGISPVNGSSAGGTTVTIMGSGFNAFTVVLFDAAAATNVTFIDANTLEADTPPHAPGAVDVLVQNLNGSDLAIGAFTYNATPSLLSVTPSSGSETGGETVTLNGTGFTADAVVSFDGIAAATTFISGTTLEAVTPPHAGGPVDVEIVTVNGSSLLPGAYTYIADLQLTSITPTIGPIAGGATVTLTGTGFDGTTTVTFDGIAATGLTVFNATTMSVLTPAHAAGTVDVAVMSGPDIAILSAAYTYVGVPTITSVTPAFGDNAGGTFVTIVGTNLGSLADTTVLFGANTASVINVLGGGTSIVLTTPSAASAGFVDVSVLTSGGTAVVTNGYEYIAGSFIRGDSNRDGVFNVADAIFTLTYLFNSGAAPLCLDAADTNDDGLIDLSDVIYTITFLFAGGANPAAPFPLPGPDPTADGLNCAQ
ncbi:MAG: IPT/TIG domain-containing protein, partial [Planctomycetota bacterium]